MTAPPMVRPADPETIPKGLREHRSWVLWRWELTDGKWTKVPYQIDRKRHASSKDPNTWSEFEDAYAAMLEAPEWGIGYVFSQTDGFTGIDFDDCLNAGTL